MRIGIVGAGNLGNALAKRLTLSGHDVMLCFSRDEAAMRANAATVQARAGSVADAVAHSELLVLAVPFQALETALAQMGDVQGRILWDCTNALKPDFSGLEIGTSTSAGERVASLARNALVVKAIPPFAELLASEDPTINGVPSDVYVCSDHEDAKRVVSRLVTQLPANAIDTGPLENARYTEPAGFLMVRLAYGVGLGPRIGASLLR